MKRAAIYEAIDAERKRQASLWYREHEWGYGDCSSKDVPEIVKAAVLAEEAGEVASAVLDRNAPQLRRELIQAAAVCVAWLEAM